MDEKEDKFRKLYEQVDSCTRCFDASGCKIKADPLKVIRAVNPQSIKSDVFLIGQALGEHTQRLSGFPYTKNNGALSLSGLALDTFLHLIGHTIDSSDLSGEYQHVYSSDVVQCFPGKDESGKGDRKPSTSEVANCLSQGFLSQEMKLVKPKLILLMGKASRNSFYKHILHTTYPNSLTEHVNRTIERGQAPTYQVMNMNLAVIPIQHPSGTNPRFSSLKRNTRLIELIKGVLS